MEIEALAKRMLGDTPAVRIGHAPKRLLVYRAVQPFSGFKYLYYALLLLNINSYIISAFSPNTLKASNNLSSSA